MSVHSVIPAGLTAFSLMGTKVVYYLHVTVASELGNSNGETWKLFSSYLTFVSYAFRLIPSQVFS